MDQTPPKDEERVLPIGVPSPAAQSWGVLISIVVIVLMVIVGAFYAWGKRVSETRGTPLPVSTTTTMTATSS